MQLQQSNIVFHVKPCLIPIIHPAHPFLFRFDEVGHLISRNVPAKGLLYYKETYKNVHFPDKVNVL